MAMSDDGHTPTLVVEVEDDRFSLVRQVQVTQWADEEYGDHVELALVYPNSAERTYATMWRSPEEARQLGELLIRAAVELGDEDEEAG
jgi:hypothetical protein